jgi:hypothetical protein
MRSWLNVRGIFYDVQDGKVHRKMCIDAQKTVQWFKSYVYFAPKLTLRLLYQNLADNAA